MVMLTLILLLFILIIIVRGTLNRDVLLRFGSGGCKNGGCGLTLDFIFLGTLTAGGGKLFRTILHLNGVVGAPWKVRKGTRDIHFARACVTSKIKRCAGVFNGERVVLVCGKSNKQFGFLLVGVAC
jgi:hypothetical protein